MMYALPEPSTCDSETFVGVGSAQIGRVVERRAGRVQLGDERIGGAVRARVVSPCGDREVRRRASDVCAAGSVYRDPVAEVVASAPEKGRIHEAILVWSAVEQGELVELPDRPCSTDDQARDQRVDGRDEGAGRADARVRIGRARHRGAESGVLDGARAQPARRRARSVELVGRPDEGVQAERPGVVSEIGLAAHVRHADGQPDVGLVGRRPGVVQRVAPRRTEPVDLAGAPFASGVPTVSSLEAACGGLHEAVGK